MSANKTAAKDRKTGDFWLIYAITILGQSFTSGWYVYNLTMVEHRMLEWLQDIKYPEMDFSEINDPDEGSDAESLELSSNLEKANDKVLTTFALCNSIFFIGNAIGAILGKYLSDNFGRTNSLKINCFLAILAGA